MPTVWHLSLPQSLHIGVNVTGPDTLVHMPTEVGPGKTRNRYSVGPQPVSVPVIMTQAELDIFVPWVKDTLKNGAEPFLYRNPLTGDDVQYRFTPNQPFSYSSLGPKWRVQLNLEIVDGIQLP